MSAPLSSDVTRDGSLSNTELVTSLVLAGILTMKVFFFSASLSLAPDLALVRPDLA